MSKAPGLAARRAALGLLSGVLEQRQSLGDLAAADGPLAPLAPEERARAQALATGTLRQLARLDAVLAPMLRKPPPAPVLNVLRVAAFEMLVDGVPDYAAVDMAVRLVRGLKRRSHLSGLVNAVARRLAREGPAAFAALPPPILPAWLDEPIRTAWGAATAQAIAAAHLTPPPLDLTPKNPAAAADLAHELGGELLPTGSIRLAAPGRITALPGYAQGAWWVQDAAVALPVRLLGDIAGARALDLCAAPGGKTMQLAAAGAAVTALDISDTRLARLGENLSRTGLSAQVVTADALNWAPEGQFDVIVLDAPCSATGTIRRHPDLPHIRPDPDLAPLLRLQADLIDRAARRLAPEGKLLYCTCSLLPAEGEGQIDAALSRSPGLARAEPARPEGTEPRWWTAEGDLRLRPDFWPDCGGMDGFFATVLTRADRSGDTPPAPE